MTKVAKGKRKRAYRPKTTSGCSTCKVRRVKCDETQPSCLRCSSTGRTCDGYSSAQSSNSNRSREATLAIVQTLSHDAESCAQSRRSLAFFAQQTCQQLAGFFGSLFWERLVLQAAHREPALRYALVAIGALHEQITLESDHPKTFALKQYSLAIKCLLTPLSQHGKRAVDVCLIASILFTCFEGMQGRHKEANSHIRSGSRLLQETVYDKGSGLLHHPVLGSQSHGDCYVPVETLANFFAVTDQSVAPASPGYSHKAYAMLVNDVARGETSLSFTSLGEARSLFDYGFHLLRHGNHLPAPSGTEQSSYAVQQHFSYMETLLTSFSDAFGRFIISRCQSLTPKEHLAVAVMKLHLLYTSVALRLEQMPPTNRPHGDELLPQMKKMVDLGEVIISSISTSAAPENSVPSYCLEMGIVIPLYTVASLCQEPSVRRRAIALLRSTSRREGLWNSKTLAAAAERIMEIEERQGARLTSFSDEDVDDGWNWCSKGPFPRMLHLDATGGRLHYLLYAQGSTNPTKVVERIFEW
ncbi:hypothetical protein S40293_03954 [Stachybotrys chartarum IBT 40293]|nr:hypothetical protein S40293_03954 [Stachybotrys chartarum IBT 40293]